MLAAIAMTEPGCGSDLKAIATRARPDGDHYVVDGAKTFISTVSPATCWFGGAHRRCGQQGPVAAGAETENLPGFRVGRRLEKLGQHASERRAVL